MVMCGDEDEDLSEDLRGLPLERRMGEEVVRVTLGRGSGWEGVADTGDDWRGNGTVAVGAGLLS
jgi:hypothetical protein